MGKARILVLSALGVVLALGLAGCAANSDYSHYDMAMNHKSQGKVDDAIEELQQSLVRDPEDPTVHDALAEAYYSKKYREQAIAEWEQALKYSSAEPKDFGPDKNGRPRKPEWISDGIEAYKNAKAKLELALIEQGDEQNDKGQVPEALASWKRAIQVNPKNAESWRRLGKAYKKEKRPDDALEAWQKVVDLVPSDAEGWKELGYAHFTKNEMDLALDAFKKFVKLKPNDPLGPNNLGAVLVKMKSFEAARDAFNEALKMDARFTAAINGLASSYYYQSNFAEARKLWKKVLELDPGNGTATENLKTLTQMGY